MEEKFYMDSPIGMLSLEFEDECVTAIKVVSEDERGDSVVTPFSMLAKRDLSDYFSGCVKEFSFPLLLQGTAFQIMVWKEVLNIPYGSTATYSEIAIRIGKPHASRAVGMACNRNPLLIAVPCHRVVGAAGKITGYVAGIERKRFLLELEKSNSFSSE